MHGLRNTAATAVLWDVCTALFDQHEDRGLSKDTDKLMEITRSSSIT